MIRSVSGCVLAVSLLGACGGSTGDEPPRRGTVSVRFDTTSEPIHVVLGAAFEKGLSAACESVAVGEGCVVAGCARGGDGASYANPGTLRATLEHRPTLTFEAAPLTQGYIASALRPAELIQFPSDALLTLSTTGSEVPALNVNVRVPPTRVWDAPDLEVVDQSPEGSLPYKRTVAWSAEQPLVIGLSDVAVSDAARLVVQTVDTTASAVRLSCTLDASRGPVVVPSEALARVRGGRLALYSAVVQTLRVEGWNVDVAVGSNLVWQPANRLGAAVEVLVR